MDPFVDAICAEPDDNLPRLIYADWLDDRGDPRGEFIRLQVADHLGEPCDHSRMAALEKQYGRKWAGPFADWAYMIGFRRGFPEHLVIQAEVFTDFADEIFKISPIRGVSLIGAAKYVRKLMRLPALDHLTALHLTGTQVGDSGVAKLARCPRLANLTALRLGHCCLTGKAIIHLLAAAQMTRLKDLDLSDNAIGCGAIADLANLLTTMPLRRLDLRNNNLTACDVDKLRQFAARECVILHDRFRNDAIQ